MNVFNGENAKIIYTESNYFDFLDFEQPKTIEILKIEIDKDITVKGFDLFHLFKKFVNENNDKLILCNFNLPYIKLEYRSSEEIYDHYCRKIAIDMFDLLDIIDIDDMLSGCRPRNCVKDPTDCNYKIYVNECFGIWFVNVRKYYYNKFTSSKYFTDYDLKRYENYLKLNRLKEEKSVKEKYGTENVYLGDDGLWRIKATDYIVSEGYYHAKQFDV